MFMSVTYCAYVDIRMYVRKSKVYVCTCMYVSVLSM